MPTLEEYQAFCNQVMQNPDNAPAIMTKLIDGVKEDLGTIESQATLIASHEVKISELRDTNHQLFLRTTGQESNKNEEQEKPPQEQLDDWLTKEYNIEVNNNE